MELSVVSTEYEALFTVCGDVGPTDSHEVRRRLVERLDQHALDVVVDLRRVRRVDSGLYTGLVLARSLARSLRRHLVVVDQPDGPVARALRRSGMHARIPLYGGSDEACAALAGIRAARRRA